MSSCDCVCMWGGERMEQIMYASSCFPLDRLGENIKRGEEEKGDMSQTFFERE